MHNIRRGYKTLPLIIDRQSTDNLYQHNPNNPVRDNQSCEHSTTASPVRTPHVNFDAANEDSNLSISGNYGEIVSQPPSLQDINYEPSHPRATALETISTLTETRSNSDPFSCNAITNLGDSTNEYTALGTIADSSMEYNSTNWLLDESFVNIFDDWNMDLNGIDTRNLLDTPQPPPTAPLSAREIPKSPGILDLGQIWYIQVRNSIKQLDTYCNKSGSHLPTTSKAGIDELFRTNIVKELRTLPCSEPLPSIDFLVFDLPLPHAI